VIVHSSWAYVITLAALLFGFIWETFHPSAPFLEFSSSLSGIFLGYITRRYFTEKDRVKAGCSNEQITNIP